MFSDTSIYRPALVIAYFSMEVQVLTILLEADCNSLSFERDTIQYTDSRID